MEIRLREYYMKRKQVMLAESRQAVAEGLSPMLQGEVAWQINATWLSSIPFLNRDAAAFQPHRGPLRQPWELGDSKLEAGRDPEMQKLRVKVALSLRPEVFAPNESPPDRHL